MKRINHYSSPLATTLFSRVSKWTIADVHSADKQTYVLQVCNNAGKNRREKKKTHQPQPSSSRAHFNVSRFPDAAAYAQVRTFQGQPFRRAYRNMSMLPSRAACPGTRKGPWGEGATQVTVRRENN